MKVEGRPIASRFKIISLSPLFLVVFSHIILFLIVVHTSDFDCKLLTTILGGKKQLLTSLLHCSVIVTLQRESLFEPRGRLVPFSPQYAFFVVVVNNLPSLYSQIAFSLPPRVQSTEDIRTTETYP